MNANFLNIKVLNYLNENLELREDESIITQYRPERVLAL